MISPCEKTRLHVTCLPALLVLAVILLAQVASAEWTPRCEARGVVVRIADGDTVDVANITYYDDFIATRVGSDRFRVRFADVNAPELSTPEGEVARESLKRIVEAHGGVVCLDVDNARTLDPYRRVIAVVYLKVNETHYLNLNKWLLVNNHAEVRDFADNEFNPATWDLYAVFAAEPQADTITHEKTPLATTWDYTQRFGTLLVAVIATIVVMATYAGLSKKRRKKRSRTRR